MATERIGVWINPMARPDAAIRAREFSAAAGARLTMLQKNMPLEFTGIDTAMVVGGDGSVRFVIDELLRQESNVRLLVASGGSQEGLFTALKKESLVTASDVIGGRVPTYVPIYPAAVNEQVFHHAAGWDGMMVEQGKKAEEWRFRLPRKLRGYAAGVWGLLFARPLQDRDGFVARTSVTAPNIGPVSLPVLRDLSLLRKDVGMISLRGPQISVVKAKAIITSVLFLLGIKPPQTIVEAVKAPAFQFAHDDYLDTVNADGEVVPIAPSGTIFVRKLDKTVQAAALLL